MSQIYRYNYQGGLCRKVTTYNDNTEITKNYLLDGTKILGEDWSDGKKLRYFYDAQGICGMRYNGVNYNFIRDEQGNVSKIMNQFKMIGEYIYDAWGNCTPRLISIHDDDISNMLSEQKEDELFVLDNNPFRWKGCYFDVDSGLYYINGRHYSPELMQYFEADAPANILSGASTVNSLDRNAITTDNCIGLLFGGYTIFPLYDLHPNPTDSTENQGNDLPEWLQDTLKVLGAIGVVVGVTALTVLTAGVTAYALGASVAMIGAITTGSAVGGVIAGGLEIGAQIYKNGISGMNLGAIAIESFTGSIYGAISGVASTTTSAALRLGMRGARVALGGLSTALHGVNNADSFGSIMVKVGASIGLGILTQGAFVGLDAYTGKLSNTVLQKYALDGALNFGTNQILLMSVILASKNVWRNRERFI